MAEAMAACTVFLDPETFVDSTGAIVDAGFPTEATTGEDFGTVDASNDAYSTAVAEAGSPCDGPGPLAIRVEGGGQGYCIHRGGGSYDGPPTGNNYACTSSFSYARGKGRLDVGIRCCSP